jgi:hypothetical protein
VCRDRRVTRGGESEALRPSAERAREWAHMPMAPYAHDEPSREWAAAYAVALQGHSRLPFRLLLADHFCLPLPPIFTAGCPDPSLCNAQLRSTPAILTRSRGLWQGDGATGLPAGGCGPSHNHLGNVLTDAARGRQAGGRGRSAPARERKAAALAHGSPARTSTKTLTPFPYSAHTAVFQTAVGLS